MRSGYLVAASRSAALRRHIIILSAIVSLLAEGLSSRGIGVLRLFMPGSGPSAPAEYSEPGHVDEAVVRDIAEWIARR